MFFPHRFSAAPRERPLSAADGGSLHEDAAMSSATMSLVLMVAATGQINRTSQYGTIREDERKYQLESFEHWWGQPLSFKLADLPAEGKVPEFRVPYAGHDYPDRAGGTTVAMRKYDRAFNRSDLATEWERRDVSVHRNGRPDEGEPRRGLFGRILRSRGPRVPSWYGHCNGWTAATIRHAEPQKSVVRNGVVFTPADIKGLLAEIYMYSPTEHLGGLDDAINPGMLHVTLGNWLGLGSHPVGMESALGEVVINYPVYSYKATVNKLSDRQHEVKNVITYTLNIGREVDVGPKQSRTMYLHYVLDTNADGQITGGRYLGDSARIDMLWTPLKPVQGGEEGNKRGNPHVDVKQVLAIWRESVSEDIRNQWLNVDPTEEDRILPASEEAPPAEATASAPAAAESPAATAAAATEATIAEPAAATPAETATPGSTTTSIETPASTETPAPPAAPAAPEPPAP
jgi:hypothetical protein